MSRRLLKSSLEFKQKTHEFVKDNFYMLSLHKLLYNWLVFWNKTVSMLQEPIKLLNIEQFELLYYRLLSVEGVTIYKQVTLVLNGFPA